MDIQHLRQLENQEANELAQIASGYKVSKENLEDLIEVRGRLKSTRLYPSDLVMMKLGSTELENFEVFSIEDLTDIYWRRPIVEYLENPTRWTDQKVNYRSLSYVIIGNELFKKTS